MDEVSLSTVFVKTTGQRADGVYAGGVGDVWMARKQVFYYFLFVTIVTNYNRIRLNLFHVHKLSSVN